MRNFLVNSDGAVHAHGGIASTLLANNLDYGALRPFIGNDGKHYVSTRKYDRKKGRYVRVAEPISNAVATLRKDEWIAIDRAVIKAAQPRLKAWADLRSANSYTIPGGWGKTVLESQSQSDITSATISMDGTRKGDSDRIHYDLVGLPLPIIHKDFKLSARQVAVSRQDGTPLDTDLVQLAARKVAEEIEKLTVGVGPDYSYAGYNIQGYTSFSGRLTFEFTDPTSVGWTPKTLVREILECRQMLIDNGYYGPYRLYFSSDWSIYLDEDYSDAKGDNTLRERIMALEGIQSLQTLDFMPHGAGTYDVVMVQMTPDVARAVTALDITTLQWESEGGMEINLRIMAIMVPQLRTDFYGNTGILHAASLPGSS